MFPPSKDSIFFSPRHSELSYACRCGRINSGPNATNYLLRQSFCSSCDTVNDNSAYWVPQLYYFYLFAMITMPSCWNGIHYDVPDHNSHVAYIRYFDTPCPPTHPVRLPTRTFQLSYSLSQLRYLFYQGWQLAFPRMVDKFLPSGLPLFHADFMNGWNKTVLGDAFQQCKTSPCPMVTNQAVCNML